MNSSLAVRLEDNKKVIPREVADALENIKGTMKIQSEKGNTEAAFLLRHL